MIGTMLVLTHFVLRKLGLTNCELPPGWPAYVCTTHEGGARTTTASVTSAPSVVAATASMPAAPTAQPPAAAPSAATAVGKASIHQSVVLEPLAAAIPQPPPCITIPNPPYPGSPCPPSKYPPYEPAAEQKMPFVIDNAAATPAFGPRAGLSMAQASAAAPPAGAPSVAAPQPTGADVPFNAQQQQAKDNCITVNASGVAAPCVPPGGVKKPGATLAAPSKLPPGSVAGGKSTLNQPAATSPSKAAPPK